MERIMRRNQSQRKMLHSTLRHNKRITSIYINSNTSYKTASRQVQDQLTWNKLSNRFLTPQSLTSSAFARLVSQSAFHAALNKQLGTYHVFRLQLNTYQVISGWYFLVCLSHVNYTDKDPFIVLMQYIEFVNFKVYWCAHSFL